MRRAIAASLEPNSKELATLGFFPGKENLLLSGKTAKGKTHFATSPPRRRARKETLRRRHLGDPRESACSSRRSQQGKRRASMCSCFSNSTKQRCSFSATSTCVRTRMTKPPRWSSYSRNTTDVASRSSRLEPTVGVAEAVRTFGRRRSHRRPTRSPSPALCPQRGSYSERLANATSPRERRCAPNLTTANLALSRVLS